LSELLETGIGDKVTPRELTPLDITIHENTPEEVLDAVKEMVARLDGTWIETDEMRQRQERFRAIFKKYRPEQKMTARINDAFLLKNPNWLE
jgi:putative glycosyltransferase (TIGR04372 family)